MITNFSDLDLTKQYSYADYLKWQFVERVELIKGWVYKMSPAPNFQHQSILSNIFSEVYNHLKKQPCKVFFAPFDVRLINKRKSSPDSEVMNVVQPDLLVVCDPSKFDEQGCIGAPDMIVEIISKGNSKRDLKDKYDLYQENGVQEYWIVQPLDQTVSVFDLKNDVYQLRAIYSNEDIIKVATLPGLSIDMNEVFN